MLIDDKRVLKGNIGFLDQAIAPLTNALNSISPLVEAEVAAVENLPDADSDENMARREKAYELENIKDTLASFIAVLNDYKTKLEKY